jgi:hypothetical protein
MQGKVIGLVFERAIELEGSSHALAEMLHAPEPTLRRWTNGRAQPPLKAFLAALEFVMAQEREALQRVKEQDGAGDDSQRKLVFHIGPCTARCSRCDGTQFVQIEPTKLRFTSMLSCVVCGTKVIHGNLIADVAKDAVQHARASLAARRLLWKKGPGGRSNGT